jgi:hypothetical protein
MHALPFFVVNNNVHFSVLHVKAKKAFLLAEILHELKAE